MNKRYYETSDMDFATVLYCLRIKLKDVRDDIEDKRRKVFVFEDDGKVAELKIKFVNRELLVDPKALWEATKTLKSLIYGEV